MKIMEKIFNESDGDYIAIKALEQGITVMGFTRGEETRSHHVEKIDKGDVLLLQFTQKTSAIKIKGNAEVYTKFGKILSGN